MFNFILISLVLLLCNICGYLIGYVRGRTVSHQIDEQLEKQIFEAGWSFGFFDTIGEYDEALHKKMQPKAISAWEEWRGYPHNRRH